MDVDDTKVQMDAAQLGGNEGDVEGNEMSEIHKEDGNESIDGAELGSKWQTSREGD